MGVKVFEVSTECKNILGVKWESKNYGSQMGVKIFYVEMGLKNL